MIPQLMPGSRLTGQTDNPCCRMLAAALPLDGISSAAMADVRKQPVIFLHVYRGCLGKLPRVHPLPPYILLSPRLPPGVYQSLSSLPWSRGLVQAGMAENIGQQAMGS
jgi:hypothetical protein